MNPTPEKTLIGQNDFNKLADWAKPNFQVQSTPTLNQTNNAIKANQPQSPVITVDSMANSGRIALPKNNPVNTGSAGIIASNPGQPSVQQALDEFGQVKQATGTQAQDAQVQLQQMAERLFGQKADAQSNQVNLENQAGILQQQKALGEINTNMANEQVALRGEQEKIRQQFGSEAQKQIGQNTLNDTYGRRLADLSIRQSAANQNITAIQTNAERQTRLLTAPLDTKIQYLSTFVKDNVDYLTAQEKEKVAFITNNLQVQKADIQALQTAKSQMITEIAKNGGGSNQELIKQIQDAENMGTVSTIGANSGFIGKMERDSIAFSQSMQKAQLGISQANLALSRAKFSLESQEALGKSQGMTPGTKPVGKPDGQTAAYATRAANSAKVVGDLTKSAISVWSNANTTASNFFKTKNIQKLEQAQANFITAVLRKESGASIVDSEFETARKLYFPQIGDKPEVLALKAQSRVDAVNGLISGAGTAYNGTFLSSPYTSELSATTPDGQVYTFESQASLDNFKNQANIK